MLTRPDRRGLAVPAVLGIAAALLLVVGVPGAFGRLAGVLTNNTDTAWSNAYYSCASAMTSTSGKAASLAYPLNEAAGPKANDLSGNSALAGTYTSTGITYRTTGGPCRRDTNGGYAITLNGSTGYMSGPTTAAAGPTTFSLDIWFRTTVAGGRLSGFGDTRTGASTNSDRQLYIDSTGKLVFGVNPGPVKTVSSLTAVTDGQWHYAVGTLSGTGLRLYLDGVLQQADPSTTTAQSFTGYWRVGYDTIGASWPNVPANPYFTGDLAWTAGYTYALSTEQVKSHYLAGTGS